MVPLDEHFGLARLRLFDGSTSRVFRWGASQVEQRWMVALSFLHRWLCSLKDRVLGFCAFIVRYWLIFLYFTLSVFWLFNFLGLWCLVLHL